MATTYVKVDENTLKKVVTSSPAETTIDRAEIQTKIDHLELQKAGIQLEINELKAQIGLLITVVEPKL